MCVNEVRTPSEDRIFGLCVVRESRFVMISAIKDGRFARLQSAGKRGRRCVVKQVLDKTGNFSHPEVYFSRSLLSS